MLLTCLALLTCACSPKPPKPTYGILKTGPEYPPWDGAVEVYYWLPSELYAEVGIVSTSASTNQPTSAFIASLKRKAASIGANGIIVQYPGLSVQSVVGPGVVMYEKHFMAIAIRIE
jgi:hypothetical protein